MAAIPLIEFRRKWKTEFLLSPFTEIVANYQSSDYKMTLNDDLQPYEEISILASTASSHIWTVHSTSSRPKSSRRAAYAFCEDDSSSKTPMLIVPENDEKDAHDDEKVELPPPKPIATGFSQVVSSICNIYGIETKFFVNPKPMTYSKSKSKSPEIVSEQLKVYHPVWRLAFDRDIDEMRKIDSHGCIRYMNENPGYWHNTKFWDSHRSTERRDTRECLYCPGSYGENILHKLVLWLITSESNEEKEEFFSVIKYILNQENHRRRLINSIYEGKEYYGETALHLCIAQRTKLNELMLDEEAKSRLDLIGLYSPEEQQAVEYVSNRKYRKFPVDPVEEENLKSLTIENRLLMYLLERGADPHLPCADGDFFSPDNAQYVAGSVLAMATRLGNRFAMELLFAYCRVDPDVTDTKGNTPLHILAWFGIHDWRTAISQELSLPYHGIYHRTDEGILSVNRTVKPRITSIEGPWTVLKKHGAYRYQKNRRYQSPLILALYRRHSTTASMIVEDMKIQRWNWAGISGSLYDLNALEPPRNDKPSLANRFNEAQQEFVKFFNGQIDDEDYFRKEIRHNALEIIVRNEDYRSLLMIPVLQTLLEAKWILYARGMYFTNFTATFLYMLLFTLNIFIWLPRGNDPNLAYKRRDYTNNLPHLIAEILLLVGTVLSYGFVLFFWTGYNPRQNLLLLIWYIAFGVDIFFRFHLMPDEENICLSLLSLIGWFRILYYAQGIRTVGPLVNIFIHIIWEDLAKRFLWIYAVVYFAFTQAIWLQMSDLIEAEPRTDQQLWFSPTAGLLRVWGYQVDQNDNQFPAFYKSKYPPFTILLYSLYIFITFVLLINVLIAMLSNTFTKTAEYTDRLWLLKWASLILEMEQQMSFNELIRFRQTLGMAVDLAPTIDASNEKGNKRGRFFWIQTIQGLEGQSIPTKIVTNENEDYDIGPLILQFAGRRFSSETWQNVEDELRLKRVEKVIGGKRVHP
ncbi:Transient receptor putative cation channel sub V member 3 [Nowakowskiella sp. JEL0407]|nr:Transient receptor putative cation channel sub V member 3 [Nowakowskiella sp. JEL0407]